MIRLLTAAAVIFMVACGGGSGGAGTPTPSVLMDLFPVGSLAPGTDYTYAVMKTVTRGVPVSNKSFDRTFELGRLLSPTEPDLNFVGLDGSATLGAGFMWTARGLELTAYLQTTWWSTDGICVTLSSPGLLVLPATFTPGATHQCSNLGMFINSASVTWVGPSAVPSYPDAQRFDFVTVGPYTNTTPGHPRSGATSHTVTGSVFVAPGVGPVQGIITQQFLAGAVVVEERKYEFTLTGTVPGP